MKIFHSDQDYFNKQFQEHKNPGNNIVYKYKTILIYSANQHSVYFHFFHYFNTSASLYLLIKILLWIALLILHFFSPFPILFLEYSFYSIVLFRDYMHCQSIDSSHLWLVILEHLIKYLIYCCCCSVTRSCLTLCDPVDYSLPGSSIHMGLLRQEYWSGLPFPSPEDLPDPGIEPAFLPSPALAGGFFTIWATREAHLTY